jgi:hypothetical protein
MVSTKKLACGLALAALFSAGLHAQVSTSTIAGVVTDPSGAGIPGADITLTLTATGQSRQASTSGAGEYVFPQLAPGNYEMTATSTGFQTSRVQGITLAIAQREVLNVTLQVGAVAEEITVTAAAAQLIDAETASLGQVVTQRTIVDLPLNGRNYLTLGALSPGVIPQIPSSQGPASFISSTTRRSDRSILVGGNRESSTSYLLDGVEVRNTRIGDSALNPSLDAVLEFKIQRNFFQAEFGNSPSLVNVASKSGSNQLHGSVYEFLRNDKLDARNFFASTKEPFKRNQFGFSLNGPVVKDKVFFMANYEGLRQRLGVIQRGLYPTQKFLGGDFSGEFPIHDPLTFDADAQTRTPFANNQVPASRINSVSKNFFPFIPVTNAATVRGANLEGTPVEKLDDDQLNFRGDWVLNDSNSIFGRFSWQDAPLIPASLVPLGGRQVISEARNVMAQWTSALSPTVVNVVRASYMYADLFGQQVPVDSNLAQEIGITGVSTVERNWGVPNVGWQTFSGIGSDGLTQGNILHNYQISESLAWVRGAHSLKFGAETRQSRMFLDSDNSPRGSFNFNRSWTANINPANGNPAANTGHPVADFLLGYPTNMSGAVGTSQTHFRFWTNNLFVQDDWKVTPELTLNLGLRWEYVTPPLAEELEHVNGFDFQTGRQLFPVLGQIRDTVIEPDRKNFAPRVGFAYSPSWGKGLVIRAGGGIYYDQTQMNEVQFITNSPPIFFQQNLNFTGRGLPTHQFGVNALPVTPVPPITEDYQTPQGTNLFAQELDARKPRVYMWTMSLQKSLGTNWLAEAAYVGSQGRRLSKRYNSDANVTPGVLYDVTPGVRLFPRLAGMLYSSQSGMSQFHALNMKLERRFDSGYSILSSYSFGHSIDTDSAGSFGSPNLNPANFQLDKGSSDFDIRQRSVTSVIYELPFGNGKRFMGNTGRAVNAVFGGWQVNGIFVFQSGVNRSVTSPNTTGLAFISQRADATGVDFNSEFTRNGATIQPGSDYGGANSELYWFNPNAFSTTQPLKFGTSGRDILSAPPLWNTDLSLFKIFPITEQVRLQFRAEMFNAWNHTNFNPPQLNAASPFLGQLQSALPPRILQFGLRLQF